jgi:hypothetical protein
MYKKGDPVQARDATQKMRVQRDQKDAAPDRPLVRCEWEGAGYDLRGFNEEDLVRSACVGEGVTSLPLLPVQLRAVAVCASFCAFSSFCLFFDQRRIRVFFALRAPLYLVEMLRKCSSTTLSCHFWLSLFPVFPAFAGILERL